MRKEFVEKEKICKEYATIDKNILIKCRLYLIVIFIFLVIAPNINFLKFNIDFNLLEFIHSDTNIALIWGFFSGMTLTAMLIVSLILQTTEK